MTCATADFVAADFSAVPDDFTCVLHFAVMRANDWGADLDGNVAGLGYLMEHCKSARAFLHCSSTAVYQPHGDAPFNEDDPLGDNHRVWDFLSTYSISKIAAEAMARYGARRFSLPTTIARLNVPYGDNGGWPAMLLDMMIGGMEVPTYEKSSSIYNPLLIHSSP